MKGMMNSIQMIITKDEDTSWTLYPATGTLLSQGELLFKYLRVSGDLVGISLENSEGISGVPSQEGEGPALMHIVFYDFFPLKMALYATSDKEGTLNDPEFSYIGEIPGIDKALTEYCQSVINNSNNDDDPLDDEPLSDEPLILTEITLSDWAFFFDFDSDLDLSEPDLNGVPLSEPDLSEPELSEPELSERESLRVVFSMNDVEISDIAEPDLIEPDPEEPDLSEPDLSEPDPNERREH